MMALRAYLDLNSADMWTPEERSRFDDYMGSNAPLWQAEPLAVSLPAQTVRIGHNDPLSKLTPWQIYNDAIWISVQGLVTSAVEALKGDSGLQFTFTTQPEAEAFPLLEKQEDVAFWAPGALIAIFALERNEVDDLWNRAERLPDFPTGNITAAGKSGRFRSPLLAEAVLDWFRKDQDFRSFEPASPWSMMQERQFPVFRPSWDRILAVRPDWRIRELVPSAFESPAQEAARLASLARTESQFEAVRKGKDLREKTRRLQELQARDRELLTASPERRAELELERKASFGREVREPSA
jgi:hypothetical protein